jgi:MFS family permease
MLAAATVTLGLIGGAEFDLVAFMTARYFGQRHFSELYGIQYAAFGVGAGFAPAIYGAINDHAGNFGPAILLSVGFLLLAVVVYYTLGRYPPGFGAHGEVQAAIDADPRLVTVEGILP